MDVLLSLRTKADNSLQEYRLSVDGRVALGRTPDSPVPLTGGAISRDHVAFESEGGQLFVIDVSVNGSSLNGRPLPKNQRAPVGPSDVVEVPGYEIRVAPAGGTPPPLPPPPSSGDAPPATLPAPPPITMKERIAGIGELFGGGERFFLILALVSIALAIAYWKL